MVNQNEGIRDFPASVQYSVQEELACHRQAYGPFFPQRRLQEVAQGRSDVATHTLQNTKV